MFYLWAALLCKEVVTCALEKDQSTAMQDLLLSFRCTQEFSFSTFKRLFKTLTFLVGGFPACSAWGIPDVPGSSFQALHETLDCIIEVVWLSDVLGKSLDHSSYGRGWCVCEYCKAAAALHVFPSLAGSFHSRQKRENLLRAGKMPSASSTNHSKALHSSGFRSSSEH